MPLYPYLTFGGNCREAFTRSRDILGGELDIMMMEDIPADEQVPPEMAGGMCTDRFGAGWMINVEPEAN